MNAPALWAKATGLSISGEHSCFWCGNPADRPYKPSGLFVGWRDIATRDSPCRCSGCEAMQDEGMRLPGYDKPQKARNYSWIITATSVTPCHKGQIAALREACLNPPEPPWSIVLAVSGQKVIAYRAPVVTDNRFPAVQMEERALPYSHADLQYALDLATRISAVCGKLSLTDDAGTGRYIALSSVYGIEDTERLMEWFSRRHEPVFQLAAFLAPSKEEACSILSMPSRSGKSSPACAT